MMYQRLHNFKVDVVFKPGHKMYIADLLSRQYLNEKVKDDPDLKRNSYMQLL